MCTVAICTYNGAKRVPSVLRKLMNQVVSDGICWEILVIDNASMDNTQKICEEFFKKFYISAKVVYEAKPGLVFARRRAALEAHGDIICFLDDDNMPATNYIQNVINAFMHNPKAGVIGSRVIPRWEVPPTPLAKTVANFALAICDLGDEPVEIKATGGGIVGAGMCIRRDLLRKLFESGRLLKSVSGRKGGNLMSGEDLAISILVRKIGYKTFYEPTMCIEHIIPPSRMKKDYLLRLYEGIGRGQASVRRIYDWKAKYLLTSIIIALKDYVRYLKSRYVTKKSDLEDLNRRLLIGRIKESLRIK